MRSVLFIHQAFPGQFKHIGPYLRDKGYDVAYTGMPRADYSIPGVRFKPFMVPKSPHKPHPYLVYPSECMEHAIQSLHAMRALRDEGFTPDVVLVHPGWANGIFIREVWRDTRIINYLEWYYDPNHPVINMRDAPLTEVERHETICRNFHLSYAMLDATWNVCPTDYQADILPRAIQKRLTVIHDGVDTEWFSPVAHPAGVPSIRLDDGTVIDGNSPVMTYSVRNLEPYRGFPQFMAVADRVLKQRPDTIILALGADSTSYGRPLAPGKPYREAMAMEYPDAAARIKWLGWQPAKAYRAILTASRVHLYLTYPFVCSWSLLEAMACGKVVVSNTTPPVEEFAMDGYNAILRDMDDIGGLADAVCAALDGDPAMDTLRGNARETALCYSRSKLLPRWEKLLNEVAVMPPR